MGTASNFSGGRNCHKVQAPAGKYSLFPNGNGRHSRLMAGIIISNIYQETEFSWGAKSLVNQYDGRTAYIKALRAADAGDYKLLLSFARS